jgi:peptide/nickel transport system permease protein
MSRYIITRTLGFLAVLLFISIVTFTLMHELPGGPWKYGQRMFSPEQIEALQAKYGLDKPIYEQYWIWLKGVVRLDFGTSFAYPNESVTSIISRTWPVTAQLGLMALVLAFVVGMPLGIIAALRQNTWVDYSATLISIFGIITPNFVWAIFFILIFSLKLKWVPTGGWDTPKQWILPVLAYSFAPMATIARYTRSSFLESMRADFVRTARAKGLKENLIITRHILKNALVPMVTVFGPIIPDMITGSIFIETIFRVPGMGRFWVDSTFDKDYPMIIGLTLLWTTLIAATYLITDVLYTYIDPRIRYK